MDFVTQVNLSLFEVWIGKKRMNTYLYMKLFVNGTIPLLKNSVHVLGLEVSYSIMILIANI